MSIPKHILTIYYILSGLISIAQKDTIAKLSQGKLSDTMRLKGPNAVPFLAKGKQINFEKIDSTQIDLSRNLNPQIPMDTFSLKRTNISFKNHIKSEDSLILPSLKLKQVHQKNIKTITLKGSITNQFDYGAIPYYLTSNNFPASLFKSNGDLQIKLFKLPLIASYYYSNPGLITGLNNYFNIKFDSDEFQKLRYKEYLGKSQKMRNKADSLGNENRKLKFQLDYLERLKIQANRPKIDKPKLNIDEIPELTIADTLPPRGNIDSLFFKKKFGLSDTLQTKINLKDTSLANINDIKSRIASCNKEINTLKDNAKQIESGGYGFDSHKLFPKTRTQALLGSVKKLEIGMCFPSYSTFLINQVALKGINTKFAGEKYFINASIGKTVVNYSLNPSVIPLLNQIQSITNLFDWNKTSVEKKIAAIKLGYGNEKTSYFAIGGLFGKGTTSPLTKVVYNNIVIEADARFVVKFLTIESTLAKSFLNSTKNNSLQNEIYGTNSNLKSTISMQHKIYGVLPRLKTKFNTSYRIIEPNFKSYGIGFIRSDIERIEGKIEQPFGSKLKLGFGYRKDRDNLKNLQSISTTIENLNYNLKLKLFKKRIDINLTYTEIAQRIFNKVTIEKNTVKSNIKTGVITFIPKTKRIRSTNTFMVNLYGLRTSYQSSNLENYSLNSFNQCKKWQINFLNSLNESTVHDSLNFSNALNSIVELGYTFSEKVKGLFGAKRSYSFKNDMTDYGFSATFSIAFHQYLNLELKAEKLVLGDYINTLNYSEVENYPYYGYVKLISKF